MPAAPIIAAAAAAIGTGYSVYSGERAASNQQKAAQQAKDNANKQAYLADQELNKANQKQPDSSALLSAQKQAGQGGVGSTLLTGAQGLDLQSLQLGKKTLLGG